MNVFDWFFFKKKNIFFYKTKLFHSLLLIFLRLFPFLIGGFILLKNLKKSFDFVTEIIYWWFFAYQFFQSLLSISKLKISHVKPKKQKLSKLVRHFQIWRFIFVFIFDKMFFRTNISSLISCIQNSLFSDLFFFPLLRPILI